MRVGRYTFLFRIRWAVVFCLWLIAAEVSQPILSVLIVLEDGKKTDSFWWQPFVSVGIISFEEKRWKQNRGLFPCHVGVWRSIGLVRQLWSLRSHIQAPSTLLFCSMWPPFLKSCHSPTWPVIQCIHSIANKRKALRRKDKKQRAHTSCLLSEVLRRNHNIPAYLLPTRT